MAASLSVNASQAGTWTLDPFIPWYLLPVVAVGAGFFILYSYRRETQQLTALKWWVLNILRIGALLVILAALLRPVTVKTTQLSEKSLLVVAFDSSSSMNMKDTPNRLSRWDFALKLFADQADKWHALNQKFEVRRILFDSSPRDVERLPGEKSSDDTVRPDGRVSNLNALLERISEEAGGVPALSEKSRAKSGVISLILTDGRSNAGGDPMLQSRTLARSGTPLYIVGLGEDAPPKDYKEILIRTIEVPERTFAGSQAMIRIEIESHLPKTIVVPLTVHVDGGVIEERPLRLPEGDEIQRLEVPFMPATVGIHKVMASLPGLPGEVNTINNTRGAFVRVYRGRLGIWYVEGAVRKEFGALRNALETAPSIHFMALNAYTRRGGQEHDLLPTTEEGWKELRLVMLGDIPASRFSPEQLARLAQFVSDGGSVLMLGGLEALGAGGWGQTALAAVMPVEMSITDKAVDGPLDLEITAEGIPHMGSRLASDPGRSAELWRFLPRAANVNEVGEVKPAARVLVKAGGNPLLVVQEYGKGRSAVFTGDATWTWIIKAGQPEVHKAFWRNLSTWLMRSDYRDADKILYVDTDRLQYLLGDSVELNAHLQDTDTLAERLKTARLSATLECVGGPKQTWEMGVGVGDFNAKNNPQRAGHYFFKVEVLGPDVPGKKTEVIAKDSVEFHVEEPDLENENPRANQALLQRLSMETNGEYFDALSAGSAFNRLLSQPSGYAKTVSEATDVWNHWSLLALFGFFLCAEWALRRTWGLA